jgi:hypothetical protein
VVNSRLRGKGGPSTGGEGTWTARKGKGCLCILFVVCNDAYGGGQISGSERRNGRVRRNRRVLGGIRPVLSVASTSAST